MKHVSKEDYLKTIYELYSQHGVRMVDIARKLNISKPSVSEMARKLTKEKLIISKPYSNIFLTSKGKIESKELAKKHEIIKKFAKSVLDHDDKTAYEEAHKLEHAFSKESIERLEEFIYGKKQEAPPYVG